MSRTWLIRGVSSGFGYEMTKQLLEKGDVVIGTVRNTAKVEDLIQKYPVNFEYLGQDTAVSEIKINDGKVIDNTFKTGRVEGLKVDADDKSKLSGAVIGLFNADETDFSEENAIETVTSDKDGSFSFEEIIFRNEKIRGSVQVK